MFLLLQVCYIQEPGCRNLSLMRLVSMGKTDLKLDYPWWWCIRAPSIPPWPTQSTGMRSGLGLVDVVFLEAGSRAGVLDLTPTPASTCSRAANEPLRSFTVPEGGPYLVLLLVESDYKCVHK